MGPAPQGAPHRALGASDPGLDGRLARCWSGGGVSPRRPRLPFTVPLLGKRAAPRAPCFPSPSFSLRIDLGGFSPVLGRARGAVAPAPSPFDPCFWAGDGRGFSIPSTCRARAVTVPPSPPAFLPFAVDPWRGAAGEGFPAGGGVPPLRLLLRGFYVRGGAASGAPSAVGPWRAVPGGGSPAGGGMLPLLPFRRTLLMRGGAASGATFTDGFLAASWTLVGFGA